MPSPDDLVARLRRWNCSDADVKDAATRLEQQAHEIERLRHALERCNEHRADPHAIIGIVDAALAGVSPYREYERPAREKPA